MQPAAIPSVIELFVRAQFKIHYSLTLIESVVGLVVCKMCAAVSVFVLYI